MLKLYDTQQGLVGRDTTRYEIEKFGQYCLILAGESSCAVPFSPLSLFFAGAYNRADVLALNQTFIDASLADALTPEGLRTYDFFFDKQLRAAASLNPPLYQGEVTRLRLSFGGPINETEAGPNGPELKYPNIYVDEEDQEDDFKDWVIQYNDFFAEPDPPGISIQYYNPEAGGAEVNSLIQGDFILAGAAGVIVVIVVCLQTGSYALALVGMFNVVLSFPVGLALYHGLLGIEHSTQLNQLTLYIILGIGADDIFVLVDAWRQSALEPESVVGPPGPAGLAKRFEWVWTRAAASMFVTSATTFVAFVMTALSPIPAIGAFGTLAAIMVLVNYLGIITFYSAFLLVWHKHFAHTCCRCCCCCCYCACCRCCKCCDVLFADGCCFCCPGRPSAKVVAALEAGPKCGSEKAPQSASAVPVGGEEFGGTVPVQRSKTPATSGTATALASADKESAVTDTQSTESPSTSGNTEAPEGSLPLPSGGAEHEDRDVDEHRCMERFCYNTWAPLVYKGRWPIMVLGFFVFVASIVGTAYLSPPDQQPSGLPAESELQKAIDKFEQFPASAASFLVTVDVMYGINPEEPLQRDGIDRNEPDDFGTLRLDSTVEFAIHTAAVQRHLVEQACYGFAAATVSGQGVPFALFGDQVDCWLHDWALWRNATLGTGSMYTDFASPEAFKTNVQAWVGTLDADSTRSVVQRAGGLLGSGGRIEWVAFTFNTTIPVDSGIGQLTDFSDAWAQKMADINAAGPSGGRRGFAASGEFAWVATSEVLVSSTYESIGVSFAVAVVFLLIFSGNWIVAAIASGTIVCIVLGVLALIAAIPGLELGTVESICATIVVGLAVDYTVHLAHSFQSGGNVGRFARSRHSLFEIGVSVVGGAATSLFAAFVLFFAKLLFFQRFGQLIFTTLLLSIILSTTLFIAALMLFGPEQHPDGDLVPLAKQAWAACLSRLQGGTAADTQGTKQSEKSLAGAPSSKTQGQWQTAASQDGEGPAAPDDTGAASTAAAPLTGGDIELVHVRAATHQNSQV